MNKFASIVVCGAIAAWAATARGDDVPHDAPTVGIPRRIKELILPGTELEAAPLADRRAPLVVRIVRSTPHGTAWRYDLTWYGLEPGDYDLRTALRRKDRSSTDELPPMPVKVASSLPPVFTPVRDPPPIRVGGFGGYRTWLVILAVVWAIGLVAILFVGRRRRTIEQEAASRPVTFAERIRPLVERGVAGTIAPTECAALERLLIEHWTARLKLRDKKPAQVFRVLREHPEAGVLVGRLEIWLHRPGGADEATSDDVPSLLKSYLSTLPDEPVDSVPAA